MGTCEHACRDEGNPACNPEESRLQNKSWSFICHVQHIQAKSEGSPISTRVWAMRASSSLRLCVPCSTAACGISIRHLLISDQIPPRSVIMTFSLFGPFLIGFCEINFYKISCCTVN